MAVFKHGNTHNSVDITPGYIVCLLYTSDVYKRQAYSTSALASPTLAAAALLGNVSQGFLVNGKLHATDRIRIASASALLGCSLAELRHRHDLLALDLRRAGVSTLLPALDITLLDGDEVTLLAPIRALKRLRRLEHA